MTAQADEAAGRHAAEELRNSMERLQAYFEELRDRVEQLQAELKPRRSSRGRLRRLLEAAQAPGTLRAEIEDLRIQLTEANEAVTEVGERVEQAIVRLQAELEREQSRGFLRRLFGQRPRTPDDIERARERIRGRIALVLITGLIVVMSFTIWYLLRLSRDFGVVTIDDLITVMPMVGSTLLTPLIGLIGAVTGFYYGGQTAVQAASQGAQTATRAATQAAYQAAQRQPPDANGATNDEASGRATAEGATRTARGRATAERATRIANMAATEETSPQLYDEIEKLRSELRNQGLR
jgi:hypothetical protein